MVLRHFNIERHRMNTVYIERYALLYGNQAWIGLIVWSVHHVYDGERVSRSRMDIKRKMCDSRNRKKTYMSSTNIDRLAPSLYQCVKPRSTEVF
jgi:hypothetical protein